MKNIALLVSLTFCSTAFADFTSVSFSESLCSGGGGSWSEPLIVNSNICQQSDSTEIIINEGGHCNGVRSSAIKCENRKISGYTLLECFCD